MSSAYLKNEIMEGMIDWNKFTIKQYIEHLENTFMVDSSGTAKAVFELINAYKALLIPRVSKRYDANKYTPPFRVGRKQGKAILDDKGIEVVFFMHSEEQAKMYCDYLNNVC